MARVCTQCDELVAAAQKATTDHAHLLSELQAAKLTRNHDEVARFITLLREAAALRRDSVLRYKQHRERHNLIDGTQACTVK